MSFKLLLMKSLILTTAILIAAATCPVLANTIKIPAGLTAQQQDSTSKTPVKIEELPDAVKATLSSDRYKDWAPVGAFLIKDGKTEYYLVDVKKAEETTSLKIGKDGIVVE
jgi:hypothetical protein